MSPSPPSTHPLEFLVGTWIGKGRGFYPTIREFHFLYEITFTKDQSGQPDVAYSEKAFKAIPAADPDGQPTPGPTLHAENGFIRLPDWSDSKCELILSLPAGVASVELGTIKGSTVQWASTQITRSPSAPPPDVTEFTRSWTVDPEAKTLTYLFSMGTERTPLTPHLEVHLKKVEASA
ncbi:THAP domain-containing protein 4 [Podila clonocystis]|nr:THAP domain-containing protein 4 [Podila clonocystis]